MKGSGCRKNEASNGNDLVARLIELQAVAQLQIAKADESKAAADKRMARAEERFNRLEQETKDEFQRLLEVIGTVMQMLERLPDAVREKIGFAAAG